MLYTVTLLNNFLLVYILKLILKHEFFVDPTIAAKFCKNENLPMLFQYLIKIKRVSKNISQYLRSLLKLLIKS